MKKYLSLIFCFATISFSLFAQDALSSKNKKAVKLFMQADGLFRQRQFEEGIVLLQKAVEKDPGFVEAFLKLGSVYKLYGEDATAKGYFEKACALQPNSSKLASAYNILANYYLHDGEYVKAKAWYEKVLEVNPSDKKLLENSKKLKASCAFAIDATNHPITFFPELMGENINKFYIHAYPVLTADRKTLIYSKRDGPAPSDDENIVISRKVDGKWTDPVSISSNIDTPYNEGACTMSADGRMLVFVSCNRPGGLGSCDLYASYRVGDDWSKPKNLGPKVNSNVWDSEPALSADGRTIYFSTERRGGFGKEDIWVTTKDAAGEWTPAKNLGAPINTSGREVSPFIHADGKTLYFSSTEHPGMGGFDIFFSKQLDSLKWSEPKNLGYPINTAANDASVFITADNSKGFYSRYVKKGIQHTKILLYKFDVPDAIKPEHKSTYASGNVFNAETKKPIHATINLVDLKTEKVIQAVESDPTTGAYLLVLTEGSQYALYIDETGYLFKSQFFDFQDAKNFNPLKLDVYLDPIKQGNSVVLNNIFFPTNQYALEEKSKTELDKIVLFLKQNPEVKIEFGGHTDNVGSDKDNMQLSLKRAEAVYKYIIQKGVTSSRLRFKGYGETKPIASNATEEGRHKNRRIEFKVL